MVSLVTRIRSSPNYKLWAASVVAIGTLLTVADTGEVNIALPTIADQFDTDLATVQWLATAYMMATSALVLPMGRLSDIVGRKKVYIWGLTVFIIGAALGGLAPNLLSLVLVRVLQGAGLGMVVGNQMAILISIFSADERGKALGLHTTMVGLGLIIGPAIGGVLIDSFGWRSIFIANVALGALYLFPNLLVLDERRVTQSTASPTRDKFDWPGAILSSASLFLFLMGMTNPLGWAVVYRSLLLGSCAILLTSFVLWQIRAPFPILDVTLFRARLFSLSVIARSIFFISQASVLFLMPFYIQGVAGYSPARAGLIMTTMAVGMAVVGPIAGRLSDVFGWRIFNVGGAALSISAAFTLSQLTPDSSVGLVILGIMLQGAAVGMFIAPNSNAIMSSVPLEKYGVISAFQQLLRTGFFVAGIAVATVVVTQTMSNLGYESNLKLISESEGAGSAFVSGLRTVYLAIAGLQVITLLLSAVGDSKRKRSPA